MTETELRRQICHLAESMSGRSEADGTYGPIIETYNSIRPLPRGYRMKPGDPWCAAYVSAVAQDAYMAGDKVWYPEKDTTVYVSTIDNNVWSPESYPAGWAVVNG